MRQARDELGVKVKKRWMAFLDSHTRDAHADLDGQIAEVDGPFESLLGPIMYPGDPDAEPANVYNCRCTLVYEYPEYPSSIDRVDERGENVGDMSYSEWREMKAEESENNAFTGRAESGIMNTGAGVGRAPFDLQLFGEKDLEKQTTSSLKKGIESLSNRVKQHEGKIANPSRYYADWDEVDEDVQQGRLNHWKKEIGNFKESIQNRKDILKQRGEK